MKNMLHLVKATIMGGLVFLVPVVLLIIIVDKVFQLSQKIITPVVEHFPGKYLAGIAVKEFAAVVLLLLICFLAGLFAYTAAGKKIISQIENGILSHIPGYLFMKKIGEGMIGVENMDDLKVVLVLVDDAWQMAFITEQIDENMFTVFVPDAPSPWSGSVYHIERSRMKFINITQKQALDCLRKLGYGSAAMLAGKI